MWLWLITCYLIAGINGAYIVTRIQSGLDIRALGSGTGGARNAGRIGGSSAFMGTVAIDALKTILPLSLGLYFNVSTITICGMIIALTTGHIWSIWLKGQGGKGIVVYLAVVLIFEFIGLLFISVSVLLAKKLPGSKSNRMLVVLFIPVPLLIFQGKFLLSLALIICYGVVIAAHTLPVHLPRHERGG